ncbi:MAG: ABC transporter ATP-binding protein [Lachnospiraceae bacterium]
MIKVLMHEIKEFKRDSILTPVFTLLEVLFEMVIPFLMASIIDQGVEAANVGHIYRVGLFMVVMAGCALFTGILSGKYAARSSAGFARNIREAMFKNIQTFSFANIDKYSTAGLVTRMTTDITNLQNSYQMILRLCTRAPASLISALAMSFYINKEIASVYLIAVIFLSVCLTIIIRAAMPTFQTVFQKYDDLNASVQENITGMRVVKAYVREEHEIGKFNKASGNLYRMFLKAEKIVVWNGPLMQFTLYSCMIAISWFGAELIVGGSLSTGELMSLLTYSMNILMSLMMLSMAFVMISISSASIIRIVAVLDDKADIVNPQNPVMEVPDGGIRFEDVSFSYQKKGGEAVLSGIDLEIKKGETIGLIGGTGSSKTSLVNLISRLYDVSEGSIKVGGIDIREYDLDSLRSEVSVVLQKNVLFSGSILENLRWGDKDASEEECIRVCKLACADEFIEQMPQRYHTYIEQGGSNVSGGQKQRLCIARALLKKPKILILDDSTSAVDTQTDAKIRKAFKEEIPDTTKIIIAQRISSIQEADRIIVLDNGKVSAFGTHQELLSESDIYRDVYESQIGGSGDFDQQGGEQ